LIGVWAVVHGLLQIVAAVRLRNVMGVPAGTVGHEAA
jgi:hypothetical protein